MSTDTVEPIGTFKLHTTLDGIKDWPYLHEFTHMGEDWVVHRSTVKPHETFRVSHKTLGWAVSDYRPGTPKSFPTIVEAQAHAIEFMNHLGSGAIHHWLGKVKSGEIK